MIIPPCRFGVKRRSKDYTFAFFRRTRRRIQVEIAAQVCYHSRRNIVKETHSYA